jgi:proteasome lid subunit RPN8/RPN11
VLNLVLPLNVIKLLLDALQKAGRHEIGGVLMAEHIGLNEFKVTEITVHRRGSIASFVRHIEDAIGKLRLFFYRTDHDYQRFNYLGEWHSHPLFEPIPSATDDMAMLQIVQDDSVGANFAVLLIVKLDLNGHLVGTAHTYLPDGKKARSTITLCEKESE